MSVALVFGAHLMLLGLVHGHAKKMAAGKMSGPQIWGETRQMALIMFVVLTVLGGIDMFLRLRASL